MSKLEELRSEIDQLDEKLIEVLAERFNVSRRVGELKRSNVLPPRDEEREQRQLRRVRDLAQAHGVPPELAGAVLRLIVDTVVVQHQEE